MDKIEECEKILNEWKVNQERAKKNGLSKLWEHAGAVVAGIELALGVFKRPSNTQMQIDAKSCTACAILVGGMKYHNYCYRCGRYLHD